MFGFSVFFFTLQTLIFLWRFIDKNTRSLMRAMRNLLFFNFFWTFFYWKKRGHHSLNLRSTQIFFFLFGKLEHLILTNDLHYVLFSLFVFCFSFFPLQTWLHLTERCSHNTLEQNSSTIDLGLTSQKHISIDRLFCWSVLAIFFSLFSVVAW